MADQIIDYDAPIVWKKINGGSLRIKGKIIKPGQRFQARPSEISKAFRDSVIPLSKVVEVPLAEAISAQTKKQIYTSQPSEKREIHPHGDNKFLFDVFDKASDKKVNESPLKKEDAEELVGFDILNPLGKVMNEVALSRERIEKALRNLNS